MTDFEFEARLAALEERLRMHGVPLELPEEESTVDAAATGQIWSARWNDVAMTVLVDAVFDAEAVARVAPLSLDAEAADEGALLIPSSLTDLTMELVVWTDLVHTVPLLVLDELVANLAVEGSAQGALSSISLDPQIKHGKVTVNAVGPRARSRRLAQAGIRVLASAADLPAGGGSDLRQLLADLSPSTVAETLGVSSATALKVLRGKALVTHYQAQLLSTLVMATPEEIFESAPGVPEGLRRELTRFQRGRSIRLIASLANEPDTEALYSLATASLALAARGDTGSEPDWAARVDRAIQTSRGMV